MVISSSSSSSVKSIIVGNDDWVSLLSSSLVILPKIFSLIVGIPGILMLIGEGIEEKEEPVFQNVPVGVWLLIKLLCSIRVGWLWIWSIILCYRGY